MAPKKVRTKAQEAIVLQILEVQVALSGRQLFRTKTGMSRVRRLFFFEDMVRLKFITAMLEMIAFIDVCWQFGFHMGSGLAFYLGSSKATLGF